MRRLFMLLAAIAVSSLPLLATAAPASAGEGCFTPHVKGFNTVEVCVLPFDPELDD